MTYSMTYTSLIGDKNTAGSIARWVNYSKLDADQILQEAQALLYSMLRVREMRAHFNFNMAQSLNDISRDAKSGSKSFQIVKLIVIKKKLFTSRGKGKGIAQPEC